MNTGIAVRLVLYFGAVVSLRTPGQAVVKPPTSERKKGRRNIPLDLERRCQMHERHILSAIIYLLLTVVVSTMSSSISNRLFRTENPYIEDVIDKYNSMNIPNLIYLAMGSSHWPPPDEAVKRLSNDLLFSIANEDIGSSNYVMSREINRYGGIMGSDTLRSRIKQRFTSRGLNMEDLEIVITNGANQALFNVVATLCDDSDKVILLAPYYFSQKLSLQLINADIRICTFNKETLYPNWDELNWIIQNDKKKTKAIFLTSPNNPSGLVWSRENILKLIDICRNDDIWLVADQTYYEFLYDNSKHIFPSIEEFHYDKIIHIFSFSKSYGIPGYRVGFLAYHTSLNYLSDSFRKLQDTIPTHTTMLSQRMACHCLDVDDEYYGINGITWVDDKIKCLEEVRKKLWLVVKEHQTVLTSGAFYFLVPVPSGVSEEDAIDILAKKFRVLLMPGSPFGAPNYMRLSYGSIHPTQVLLAIDNIKAGLEYLRDVGMSQGKSYLK